MTAAALEMGDLLPRAGFRLRSARRADCAKCRGRSVGTVSYTEQLAHCFRCEWAANTTTLARELGLLAGDRQSRREWANQRRARQAVQRAAEKLAQQERQFVAILSARLRQLYGLRRGAAERLAVLATGGPPRFSGEAEAAWTLLADCAEEIPSVEVALDLLSFGSIPERIAFVRGGEGERRALILTARERGFVVDDRGRIREVD